jgi:hypothetical protein
VQRDFKAKLFVNKMQFKEDYMGGGSSSSAAKANPKEEMRKSS